MFNNYSFETGDLTGWIKLGELTFNNYSFETEDLTSWTTITVSKENLVNVQTTTYVSSNYSTETTSTEVTKENKAKSEYSITIS